MRVPAPTSTLRPRRASGEMSGAVTGALPLEEMAESPTAE